jgi:protein-tyrosine-phosphatase
MPNGRLRVLFLCTGNTARSQMAEALLCHLSRGRADAFSAGTAPGAQVHPLAAATLQDKYNIDPSGLYPKSMEDFLSEQFDFVITVCDQAAEACPIFPGNPERIHWRFEDPAAVDDPDRQRRAFEGVAGGLAARLRIWLSLPEIRQRLV